jgi:hypothetical protein
VTDTKVRVNDPVPPVVVRLPDCPVCGDETWHDGDSLRCEPCGFSWSESQGNGTRRDGEATQCAARIRPYADHEKEFMRAYVYRCCRTAGHPLEVYDRHTGMQETGPDYSGMPHEWTDDEPGAIPAEVVL